MTDLPLRCPTCDGRIWARSRIDHLGRVSFLNDPHVCQQPRAQTPDQQWKPKGVRKSSKPTRPAALCACGRPRVSRSKHCRPCGVEHKRRWRYEWRQTEEYRARRHDRYVRLERRSA